MDDSAGTRRVFAAAFYGNEQGKIKIENKEQADAILAQLEGAQYRVKTVKKGTRRKSPRRADLPRRQAGRNPDQPRSALYDGF